jgi:hypothetical protein
VSQLLKRIDGLSVYSQPPVINNILMPPSAWTPRMTVDALRLAASLFAKHAAGPYVLKLESWNVLFFDEISRAFPDTPWIFCVRDPVEVAMSVMADPDPPTWFGCFGERNNPFLEFLATSDDITQHEYLARVYAMFCSKIRTRDHRNGLLVEYGALRDIVQDQIAGHFELAVSPQARRRMSADERMYSKALIGQEREFIPDAREKQSRAPASLKEAAERYARPALDALRAKFEPLVV